VDKPHDLAPSLPSRPHEDLAFIRRTLEAAGRLSIVPGTGMALIGLLALAAVIVNEQLAGGAMWNESLLAARRAAGAGADLHGATGASLKLWIAVLLASVGVGVVTMRAKARRTGQMFWSPVLRKALWGYSAAMLLGALLTFSVMRSRPEMVPEIWLGCYGAALVGAGTVSISPIRWMGGCFLTLAALAAFDLAPGSLLVAAGFGGLHIAFGAYIAWRHDG
jgi:hypothetical protein